MFYKRLLESYNPQRPPAMRGVVAAVGRARGEDLGTLYAKSRVASWASLRRAQPFQLTPEAWALANSIIDGRVLDADQVGDVLRRPMPFPSCFVEIEDLGDKAAGVLLATRPDGTITVQRFLDALNQRAEIEPLVLLVLRPGEKIPEMQLNEVTLALVEQAAADGRLTDGRDGFQAPDDMVYYEIRHTLVSMALARAALDLLVARTSPYVGETAPLMSRQERRALERAGRLPEGPATTVTRMRLNGPGRAHLQALEAAEGHDGGDGEGVRRRAHWVRGHLMAKVTKGLVWRGAHVRGFGQVNPTLRVVEAPVPEAPVLEMNVEAGPEAPGF